MSYRFVVCPRARRLGISLTVIALWFALPISSARAFILTDGIFQPDCQGGWTMPFGEETLNDNDNLLPGTEVSNQWAGDPTSGTEITRNGKTGRGWSNATESMYTSFEWSIANNPDPEKYKLVRFLFYWYGSNGGLGEEGGGDLVDICGTGGQHVQLLDSMTEPVPECEGWNRAIYLWKIDPQPAEEIITLNMYVQAGGTVIIASPNYQTKCVPEPAVASLLGLGLTLLLLRRRA